MEIRNLENDKTFATYNVIMSVSNLVGSPTSLMHHASTVDRGQKGLKILEPPAD